MRKIHVFGLAALAAFALACSSGGASSTGNSTGGSGSGGKTDGATTAKIGQAARDGKLEFTVQTVKCGVKKVGSGGLGKDAQGQFCLVTVKVSNIGKEAQTFSDSGQKGYAADGTEYSTDTTAAIYANKDAATFLNEINPGNGVTGVLVFDIPANVTLAKLELHDSPFSGGVTVQLA
jgi:hypothetical protein